MDIDSISIRKFLEVPELRFNRIADPLYLLEGISKASSMKVLDLPLKRKWYELIESGRKTEEYRDVKPYWSKRFLNQPFPLFSYRNGYTDCNVNGYTHVRFRFGYTRRTMLFLLLGIRIGIGNPAWGAPSRKVFILSLGKQIK